MIFFTFFVSCSNDTPELSNVSASVIFDYKDEKSGPQVRLSIFAQVESDANLVSNFTASCDGNSLSWHCSNVRKISNGQKTWVGYTNFVPEYGENFPKGRWTFFYEDASERDAEFPFYVDYPEEIFKSNCMEFLKIDLQKTERIVLYSQDKNLVYFGEVMGEWVSDAQILATYKNAVFKRTCYSLNDDKVFCLMPLLQIEGAVLQEDFGNSQEDEIILQENFGNSQDKGGEFLQ